MRDLEKWTRAHDTSGWRYEFQCSHMAESFNKFLLGIRGMPLNTIVQFTFYKLIAWFNDRHDHPLKSWSDGEIWPPKPKEHLEKAIERASTHEVTCFDHATGTYQVEHRGGTMSDGEVQESRMHVVILQNFTCTCGKPRQYHFLCSHLVVAADITTMISRAGYLTSLVSTCLCTHGAPASCLSGTLESGLHMMGQSTLRIQLTVGISMDQGRGRGIGWLWIRYPKERGVGEKPHYLLTPSSMSAASAVDWATIHALAIGRLVRCDYWLFSLFHIFVNYLYISKFMFHCILNLYFIDFL